MNLGDIVISMGAGFAEGVCEAKGIDTGIGKYALFAGPAIINSALTYLIVRTENKDAKRTIEILGPSLDFSYGWWDKKKDPNSDIARYFAADQSVIPASEQASKVVNAAGRSAVFTGIGYVAGKVAGPFL